MSASRPGDANRGDRGRGYRGRDRGARPSGTVDALFFWRPGVTAATIAAIVAILAGPAGGAVVAVAGLSLDFPLIAEGFSGRIAAERRPRVVEEVRDDEVYSPFLREQVRSLLGVPLLVRGEVLGVLYVGSSEPRHFTGAETELLELVADRFAWPSASRTCSRRSAPPASASRSCPRRARCSAAARLPDDAAAGRRARGRHLRRLVLVDLARDGRIERLLIHHRDPARVAAGQAFSARFGVEHGEGGPATVATTGQVAFAPAVSGDMVEGSVRARSTSPSCAPRRALVHLRPVVARGEPWGDHVHALREPRAVRPRRSRRRQGLRRRAGAAIDTARLYRSANVPARPARSPASAGRHRPSSTASGIVQVLEPAARRSRPSPRRRDQGSGLIACCCDWEEMAEPVPVGDWPAVAQSASRAAPVRTTDASCGCRSPASASRRGACTRSAT